MRKPTRGETVGTIAGLGVGALLGGVVVRGMVSDGPENMTATAPLEAVIAHTENNAGKPIGVATWANPFTEQKRGKLDEATRVDVVCIEPDGRELIDADVPADQPTNRGNDWYLLTATRDPGRQEWVSTSYVDITDAAGSAALAECATIEGLNQQRN